MYKVKETLQGRNFPLIHSAPQLPMSTDISWWLKTKLATGHIAAHKAPYVCVTSDADGTVIWRAGPARGFALAPAVEDWLAQNPNLADREVVVVIPLDVRVYIAQVENGLVTEEFALVMNRATTMLKESVAQNRHICAFDTGSHTCAEVRSIVRLDALPFDLTSYRYERAPVVFAKHRLPHKVLLIPPIFAAVLYFLLSLLQGADTTDITTTVSTVLAPEPKRREASFASAADLRILADAISDSTSGHLLTGGLKTIRLEDGVLRMQGKVDNQYPERAIQFAGTKGMLLRLDSKGWLIRRQTKTSKDIRPVAAHPHFDVLRTFYAGAGRERAKIKIRSNQIANEMTTTHLEISLSKPRHINFRRLAKTLDNQPIALTSSSCSFQNRITTACKLTFTVTGMAPESGP